MSGKDGVNATGEKLMTKVVVIRACRMCHHLSTDMARNCWRCKKEDRAIIDNNDIPKWCPLEDVIEENDDW